MAIIKTEIRPKGTGTYEDVLYPRTSLDMVEGGTDLSTQVSALSTNKTDKTYVDAQDNLKINKTQIKSTLTETVTGNVLDATQGKVLNDAISEKAPIAHTHDDRYYTETETNTLLNDKAPMTHTHTSAQITNMTYPVTSIAGKIGAVTLTSADVGLGNVNNWGASTAVNSTSATTYATSSAVKQAYDLANHAHPYAPAGYGLGSYCATISDWNEARTNGYYMGAGCANAPDSGWWMGYVIAHNDIWITQIICSFSTSQIWRIRHRFNGTWGAWGYLPKESIGLGNVNNWGATSAVNDASTTTYATSSAVKQAYDLANHAHPYAPSTHTHSASQISAGTMTGIVTAQNNSGYTTKQVRNIILNTTAATGGANGDVWIQYI